MERLGSNVTFLDLDDVCRINKEWIERYGGRYIEADYNLRNRPSLEYILLAVRYQIFGYDRFPTIVDKAAALGWWINGGHIFWDGNKRTGMQSIIELLELNGVRMNIDINSIIQIGSAVGEGIMSLEELTALIPIYIRA